MNKDSIKVAGIKDILRKDAYLFYVNQKEGLKEILDKDFSEWSNFDIWESIGVQQLFFRNAMDVDRGMKIDIKCDCCESIDFFSMDFDNIEREKCYGKKSAYIIKKIVNEIVIARVRRESDGTYSS